MGQAFLASYLIGLREGLEVTLVVSILIAYLVKSDRRRELLPLWAGVAAAIVLSVLFGALLTYTETTLLADTQSRELFEAITSVVAVVLVTWMIFWMRRTARRLKGELTGRLASAVGVGGLAVAGIAFVSVIREGLETALLFYTAAQGATSTLTPLLAISAGIATSVLIGFGLYAGALRRPADLCRGRDLQVRHPRLPGGRRPPRWGQPGLRHHRRPRSDELVRRRDLRDVQHHGCALGAGDHRLPGLPRARPRSLPVAVPEAGRPGPGRGRPHLEPGDHPACPCVTAVPPSSRSSRSPH
jgi:hypothetical protein